MHLQMYVCALCARCQRARTYLLWLFLCHRRARPMPHSRLFAATPAKLHSHDAMPHRARTVCVLCSHCLACCGMAVCARVRSGISLSSASLLSLSALAHFLLPPSSSSSAKCYVLLKATAQRQDQQASAKHISRSRGRPRPGRLRKYNYYFHLFAAPPPTRILRVRARVRALYFSNTPAARHAVIACALYFVFFFFLLCAVFFSLQRLPATLRAEARRRACPPAACACCVRERQPALFRLLLLLLVEALPLAGCRCRCCFSQILRAAHSS